MFVRDTLYIGGRWVVPALAVVAGAAAVALALHLVLGAQDNLRWIALLLPVHLALWATWRRGDRVLRAA